MTGLGHNQARSLDLLRIRLCSAAKESIDLDAAERGALHVESVICVIQSLS